MSILTFLTKIISCIHRFSRKRTYICTSLVSENRMTRNIYPQKGFHHGYLIKHVVRFENEHQDSELWFYKQKCEEKPSVKNPSHNIKSRSGHYVQFCKFAQSK